MNAFLALVRKDVTLYFRNRRAVIVTLAAPILIAAFFGAVLGGAPKKPSRVPVAVVDLDGSAVTADIVKAMKADTAFDLRESSADEGTRLVREGKVRAAVVIPAGFGDAAPKAFFSRGTAKPEIAVQYDPSQAMALPLVKGLLAEHVMKGIGRAAFEAGLEEMSLPFTTRESEVAGPRDAAYNGYAHAFAGMGVQFILFMGIELGVGLLLMRRMGLWKRLRAAPVSRGLLLGSRIASGTVIALILFAGIYAAAVAVFGVRVRGSIGGFVAVALAFALLSSTFGLLIAAIGKTPEATRGLAILATLLLVMLGGAWVPTFVFPDWLQSLTAWVPTRWAIDGLEAMTWRGLDLDAAMMPVAAMLAVSAVFALIATRRFRWEE